MFSLIRVSRKVLLVAIVFSSMNAASVIAKGIDVYSPHLEVAAPDGDGPFPTMLMLAGCSGFNAPKFSAHYDAVQKTLVDAGFMTVRVDVHAAHGADTCRGLISDTVAPDVNTVLVYVNSLPNVKRDAISLIGWSYGAKVALQSQTLKEKPDVDAVIAYYPNCRFMAPWSTKADVLLLYGDKDELTPSDGCDATASLSKQGAGSRKEIFAGAYHLFDFAHLEEKIVHFGHTMVYEPAAAKKAWDAVLEVLSK